MIRAGTVPPELADAHRLVLLADSGLITVGLNEYDKLPAPLAVQVETIIGSRMKRQADQQRRAESIRKAKGAFG